MAGSTNLCCALGAVLTLTNHELNLSFSVNDVMPRCGSGCRGVGMGQVLVNGTLENEPLGCSGVLTLPPLGKPGCGDGCYFGNPNCTDANMTLLTAFKGNPRFGGTNSKGVCRGPVCAAVYGKVVKIHPRKPKRPIRVHAVAKLQQRDAIHATVIEFAKNKVPRHSDIKGPLTIRCTNHSNRLSVGEGTKIELVHVDCSDMCPLHVQLNRKSGKTHTRIIDVRLMRHTVPSDLLAEAEMCSTLITPVSSVDHPRDFVGRGKIEVVSEYGHNIAVANINGELVVTNKKGRYGAKRMNVTLLDSLEDSGKRLTVTVTPVPDGGDVHIYNITAVMDVFSQEYLVGFFGPSPRKELEMKTLMHLNWTMAAVILALLAGDPDTIPRALPKAWSKKSPSK